MSDAPRQLHHLFTHFRSLGGVQSVLKRHMEVDSSQGFSPRLTAFFEQAGPGKDRIGGAGLTWKDTIASSRKKIASTVSPHFEQPLVIAHNLWGLTFWADLIPGTRRIGVLHSDWPGMPRFLSANRGLLDGMLCVSPQLMELARKHLPELGADRLEMLPYPVRTPSSTFSRETFQAGKRPVRIGFCGRVQRAQKRVDRIPELLEALEKRGVSYQFECIGDGPELPWLIRQLGSRAGVKIHGRLQGEEYWRALARLDLILFVSDYEGLPIALLEALSAGVIPLFPKIGCGGDSYVSSIDASLLHEPGRMDLLADAVQRLACLHSDEWSRLSEKARTAAIPHAESHYFSIFTRFVIGIESMPRISSVSIPSRRFHWSDYCPFGLLSRAAPGAAWRSPL